MRRRTLLSLSLAVTACNRSTRPVVGVVPKGANHIFWQTVHAGAIKAAREFNFDVEWNSPTMETDASRQIAIVESMVNRRLAGVVLAPIDSQALVPIVNRAAASNVPVAIFDSGINTDRRVFFIATDNMESGRMAARRMGELLGGKGKVAVVGFKPGSASTMERERGFEEGIKRQFPQVQIVGLQYAEADRAKARAITENFLTAHPDLSGIFADNESSSAGASQGLKGRGSKAVKLVAYDASEQLLADLNEGWIDSIVVQDPFKMGYEATRAVGLTMRGERPGTANVDSGAVLVTRNNQNEPAIRDLLHPPIQQYLGAQGAGH